MWSLGDPTALFQCGPSTTTLVKMAKSVQDVYPDDDPSDTIFIPWTKCTSSSPDKTYVGKITTDAILRLDCAEDMAFWVEIDLTQSPSVTLIPAGKPAYMGSMSRFSAETFSDIRGQVHGFGTSTLTATMYQDGILHMECVEDPKFYLDIQLGDLPDFALQLKRDPPDFVMRFSAWRL